MILWRGLDEWTAEAARVELGDDGLRASGTQLGNDQTPYRVDYALDASGPGFVTRHLRVAAAGEGWRRSIDLVRGDDGAWRIEADAEGEVALAPPGLCSDSAALDAGTLDCDLGFCPLTNVMPVLRHGLHRGPADTRFEAPGDHRFTMAWVSVPDLVIHVDEQRYEHLAPGRVRFSQPSGFSAELELDDDGLVLFYPGIAARA